MIAPALQQLHVLWWQPGAAMDSGWWSELGLAGWEAPYRRQPALRPAADRLVAARLGHAGGPPALSPSAAALLNDAPRRDTLCIALGLWSLQCPDYLLLRPYRQALADFVDTQALNQLQMLFPVTGGASAPALAPHELPAAARRCGATWLGTANDPAIRLCRLYAPPAAPPTAPSRAGQSGPTLPPVLPLLARLQKWL